MNYTFNRKLKVNVPKVHITKTEKHISVRQLLLFALVFGALGTFALFRSFAATTTVATWEVETASLPASSSIVSESAASAGKALLMPQDSTVSTSITIPAAASSLALTARADQCSGSPTLAVTIDGQQALSATSVSATTYTSYNATKALTAGTHQISITGSNLGSVSKGNSKKSCSRVLYLDVLTLYGVDAAPMPVISLSASPTTVNSGSTSTLTWSATNATSCTASGGWSGSLPTSGSQATAVITANSTYNLSCTGSGGTAAVATTVTVNTAVASNVPTTIASDCSVDVTTAMLNWINSVPNNYTLSFGSGKCYRLDGTVEVRGRSGLTFEGNGATFKSLAPMTSGSATDDQRAMFRVIGSTNFIFRNMTIIGAYTKGGTLDNTLQHAHGFDIRGTSVEIANTNVSNVAGDCAYFGLGYDNVTRSSGKYHDSTCTSIGRNGLAVTAGNDIRAERNTMSNLGFDAFDVEPNVGTYTTSTGWGSARVTIDSNTIKGYYRLYAYSIVTNAPNIDQYFTNNKVVGNGLRIGIVDPNSAAVRATNVNITGNTADTATWSPALEVGRVDILNVTNNTVPMGGGTMATVDHSCKVNVSGNVFAGGTTQFTETNPTTGC